MELSKKVLIRKSICSFLFCEKGLKLQKNVQKICRKTSKYEKIRNITTKNRV